MNRWWMIRAGDDNELIPLWRDEGIASVGWFKLSDTKGFNSKYDLLMQADDVYNDRKPNSSKKLVNQLWRFSTQIKKGGRVITYLKNTRKYLVGTVIKEHFYNEEIGDSNYPNHIRVNWEETLINRDTLPQATKNSLGSTLRSEERRVGKEWSMMWMQYY